MKSLIISYKYGTNKLAFSLYYDFPRHFPDVFPDTFFSFHLKINDYESNSIWQSGILSSN